MSMDYGQQSFYLCEDDRGVTHDIPQAICGEEGGPFMPVFECISVHKCSNSISDGLLNSIFVPFSDDIHLVCRSNFEAPVHDVVREDLQRRTNIDIHCGKTKILNRSGDKPMLSAN